EAELPETIFETLSEDEPYLMDLRVIARGAASDIAALVPLWEGRELFRTQTVRIKGATIFRAYVPFHSGGGLRLARIDLDAAAADFLIVHARHNIIVASTGGLALLVLSGYALWAMRRAARYRERELEMAHLAHLGEMSAALAHEIRNPLGAIKGFVQLAAERADAATRDLLKPVLGETSRLEALVNDLLSYGRAPRPDLSVTSWNKVARGLMEHGRQMIGDRSIQLQVVEAEIEWRTDPALLTQALLNLLRNAIEAIPKEGEVRIEARRTGRDEVSIAVTDTGAGIADEAIGRLFDPFFTTKASGTGLGLAITRRVVAALGGEVVLRRRPEGGTDALIRIHAPAIGKTVAV
ncbi:MAG: hypothetical protein KJZ78_02120, partial [Bryobacteraceae bacterium]|nr:hypothetical protein [Bryobacteraceae bacterium]